MAEFLPAHQKTMNDEGGYANNPDDHGRETYKGIARAFWGQWLGWKIIDAAKANMKPQPLYGTRAYRNWVAELNEALAANTALQKLVLTFYAANFWNANRLDAVISQSVANWIYNHAVNGGARGIKWIQEAAGVTADGSIGPKTIAAINAMEPGKLLDKAMDIAVEYRLAKVRSEPSQKQFLHSWLARDGVSEAKIKRVLNTLVA